MIISISIEVRFNITILGSSGLRWVPKRSFPVLTNVNASDNLHHYLEHICSGLERVDLSCLLLSELKELRLGSNEIRGFSSNEVGTAVNSLLSPKSAR